MEPAFRSNQDLYDYLDGTIAEMRAAGLNDEAQRIHVLLHVAVWTTSTELFDELGEALLAILSSPKVIEPIRRRLQRCATAVDAALPEPPERGRWRAQ